MCSSLMIVLLWKWLTGILGMWIQNIWQDVSNMEYFHLSCKKSYLLLVSFQHIIHYAKFYFYFYRHKGKINSAFSYTATSIVWPEKISSPTTTLMKLKPAYLKYGRKTKKPLKCVINRTIRLTRNIQTFRRIIIRSAMKHYLQ